MSWNRIATFLCGAVWLEWFSYVRGGDLPLLKLRLDLDVPDCTAFDSILVGRAYCTSFSEEANFADGTYDCLTRETGCVPESRRKLLWASFSRRSLASNRADVVLGGTLDGLVPEVVEEAASAIFANETRFVHVKEDAVEILETEGAFDAALQLNETDIRNGTATVDEDVIRECDVDLDCEQNSQAPICESGFCVACNTTFEKLPTLQGNCVASRKCLPDGSCFQQQVITASQTTSAQIQLEWECPGGCPTFQFELQCFADALQDCQLDASSAGTPQPVQIGDLNGTVTRLNPSTDYTCFVVGNDTTNGGVVCSRPTDSITTNCEGGVGPLPQQGTCPENFFCRVVEDEATCVPDQCEEDMDCAGDFPICRIESSPRLCIECAEQETPAVAGNCGEGRFCRSSGMCSEDQCSESIECGESLVCFDSTCVECTEAADCDADRTRPVCAGNNTCVACTVQFPPQEGEGGCEPGLFCRTDGTCQPTQCSIDSDCGESLICQNSACVTSTPPGEPLLPSPTVNARSVSLSWSDGEEGVPLELYGLQCLGPGEACDPSAIESYNVQRGTEFGVESGLQSETDYTCYVIASNTAGANCSEPTTVSTLAPTESRTVEIEDSVDFGFAVAVSANGLLAVVSDPGIDDNRGAVYLLEFNAITASWEKQRTWLGDQAGSWFGHSVSINEDGNIIVAGAPKGRQVGIVQSSSGSEWPVDVTFISKPDTDGFGTSVSVSGRKAVVGSPSANPEDPGSVFVLELASASMTVAEDKLVCPGSLSSCGAAVSIKGNRFVVGGPNEGKVYLYELEGVTWTLSETFDKPVRGGFGKSLALEFSTSSDSESSFVLLVGAPSDGVAEGIVYFFEESDQGAWMEGPSFQPTGASVEFGRSVALRPLSVATQWAVGDPNFTLNGRGAFFVGVLSDGALVSVSEPQTLTDRSKVGRALALGGSQVVVGSSLSASLSSQISSQQVETVEISTEFTEAANPGFPGNLQADPLAESIAISWTVGLEGTPEEYYTVKCVRNWTENCLAPASGLQVNNIARVTEFANVTGLQPGQPYSCFVIANNIAVDFCQVQSSINVTTARQPEAPTNLSLILLGNTFASISFNAGAPQGIPAERFFAKCVRLGGGCFASAVGQIVFTTDGGQDATVEDLPENNAVDCFVIASNNVARFNPDTGIGGICSESLTVTTLLAPGQPVDPRLSTRTNQSVELEWEDGSEGIPTETFTLRSVLPGGTCGTTSQGFPPLDPIARRVGLGSVSGLSSGNTFVSFVVARNNVTSSRGVCSQSVTATTTRLPSAPNSVGIQDIEERSVVLVWTDGSIPGVPAERFTVKCGELNAVCENATVGSGENVGRGIGEGIITGLTPNQEYTCFVSARSNGGPEVCSNGVFVRTDASFCFPATLPAMQGSCEGDEFCRIDGTCSTQQCESNANCGGTAPICNIENLCTSCNSTTVGTQGECDSGLFCSDSGACLPARPPGSASGLSLVQRNTSDITIQWIPGTEGFPEETYEVKCVVDMEEAGCLSPSQGTSAENLPRSQSPIATVTFLSPGVEYLCFVIGNNAATGTTRVCSNGLSVQTRRPPPRPINVGIAEALETAVTLEWTEGPPGVPVEQYEVRCQKVGTVCQEPGAEQGISSTGIGRGVGEGTVSSLVRNTDYICFVVAYSSDEEPVCSAGVNVRSERRQCNPSIAPPVQGSCPDDDFCIEGLCFSTQCRTSDNCGGNRPICEVGQCIACSPSTVPAIMGNCANNVPDTFCSADGACLPPTLAGPPGGLETLARTPSSVNVSWSYGTEAFPQETYTLKCVIPGEDCAATAQGLAESDMPRGPGVGGRGSVTGLAPGTNYDCFVLAVSPAEQNETNVVCSSPLLVQTFQSPSPPENITLLSSSLTSLEIGWEDGIEPGIPEETFGVRCYEGAAADCQAPNPASEVGGVSRGVQLANVTGLSTFTEYTCYVLAFNTAAPDGVCSDSLETRTDECETDEDCDDYDNPFCLDSTPTRCVPCPNDNDCPDPQTCDNENECVE